MTEFVTLDLTAVRPEIDRLAEAVKRAHDASVFQAVPELLRRIVGCPTRSTEVDHSWNATLSRVGSRTTVICWDEDSGLVLTGGFEGAALESWSSATKSSHLDSVRFGRGELFSDGAERLSGATRWMNADAIERRAEETLTRWKSEHQDALTIRCSACAFLNAATVAACVLCGAALSAEEQKALWENARPARPAVDAWAATAERPLPVDRAASDNAMMNEPEIVFDSGQTLAVPIAVQTPPMADPAPQLRTTNQEEAVPPPAPVVSNRSARRLADGALGCGAALLIPSAVILFVSAAEAFTPRLFYALPFWSSLAFGAVLLLLLVSFAIVRRLALWTLLPAAAVHFVLGNLLNEGGVGYYLSNVLGFSYSGMIGSGFHAAAGAALIAFIGAGIVRLIRSRIGRKS